MTGHAHIHDEPYGANDEHLCCECGSPDHCCCDCPVFMEPDTCVGCGQSVYEPGMVRCAPCSAREEGIDA